MNNPTPLSTIATYTETDGDHTQTAHTNASIILDLRVRNHPGVMSHITGLFARRAFNLEAILCVPVGDATQSRMLLLVANTPRLEQIKLQLGKLHDVINVRLRPDLSRDFFAWLSEMSATATNG